MPLLGAFIVPHPPIVVPEIGAGSEKEVQHTVDALHEVGRRIAALAPETIIVISPHIPIYEDYLQIIPGQWAKGDFAQFGAPQTGFLKEQDEALIRLIEAEAAACEIPAGTWGESRLPLDHGALVPLYFVEEYYGQYQIVRISISGLGPLIHYRFGQCLRQAIEKSRRKTIILASGDLSHKLKESGPYGFAPEGPAFDREIIATMAEGDFLKFLEFDPDFVEAAAVCGLPAFIQMAGAFDCQKVQAEFLSYEGNFGVGYAVCAFTGQGADESRCFGRIYEAAYRQKQLEARENEDEYTALARRAIEAYIKEGKIISSPVGLSAALKESRGGVFVTLKKHGHLRGCIGTIEGTKNSLAEEIIANAVSAASSDPRFEPVEAAELGDLTYSVDVLFPPEQIEDAAQLNPAHYGVIVSRGGRKGLLLPDLAGVDTPEKQISIALQKAGIAPHEAYTLQRFKVVRHQ